MSVHSLVNIMKHVSFVIIVIVVDYMVRAYDPEFEHLQT